MMKTRCILTAFLLWFFNAAAVPAVELTYPDDFPPNTLGPDVFGNADSLSPGLNVNLSGNTVTVTDTPGNTLTGNVFGGQSDTPGNAVFNNSVVISGGLVGTALPGTPLPNITQPDAELGNGVSAGIPTAGSVFGGVATGADAYNNTVTVNGGEIRGAVIGGMVPAVSVGNVDNNRVFISGGRVDFEVNGATTDSGDATNNTVTISGGAISGWVHGASVLTGTGTVAGNTVIITGGEFADTTGSGVIPRVYGGITESGLARDNAILVSSLANPAALATRSLYGGGSISGDVENNSVTIANTPGFQALSLNGGFGGDITLGHYAVNNTVSLIDSPNFAVERWVRGGRLQDNGATTGGMNDGNTLNLIRSGGRAGHIAFFENYNFFLPNTLTTAAPLVEITGADPVNLAGANVHIQGLQPGGPVFRPGATVTLFSKAENLTPFDARVRSGLLDYNFHVFTDDALRMRLDSAAPTPPADTLPSGPAAAGAVLIQGGDLIADLAAFPFLEPDERRKMPTVFGVVSGNSIRYNIGSHIDVRGVNAIAGLDWNHAAFGGGLDLAAFFETGWGDYDSSQNFGGLSGLSGDGDIRYYGGGALASLVLPCGWHAEASARAGSANIEFKSRDIADAAGQRARYEYDAPYYGAHAGTGYTWTFGETSALDVYAKYLWIRLEHDDVAVQGQRVHFDDQDSQRLRVGGRYSHVVAQPVALYGGAGWEYEFSGKSGGDVEGYRLQTASLKGGSALGEIGLSCEKNGLNLDLNVKGFLGKREGVSGRLMIGYSF